MLVLPFTGDLTELLVQPMAVPVPVAMIHPTFRSFLNSSVLVVVPPVKAKARVKANLRIRVKVKLLLKQSAVRMPNVMLLYTLLTSLQLMVVHTSECLHHLAAPMLC